jgi:GNAT superfamily N-acetyltransferase
VIEVKTVTKDLLEDAESLFESDSITSGCFCMWFIVSVAEYHAGGASENRKRFRELEQTSHDPVGLLAYEDGNAVGWCAAGPRSRYVRALRIPTFKGRDPSEDDTVWLVPCFFVSRHARRNGVARALLKGAVDMAQDAGAPAIEGFPFARGAKLGKDPMVGLESVFEACSFQVTRRPSSTRVVMRRELHAV